VPKDAAPFDFERAKVCDKGLLTWPAAVTSKLGLNVGDFLFVFVDGRRVTMVLESDLPTELARRKKQSGTRKRKTA
jgi:bifunctional DNA-binding transcriptional regulator/antitoxin component of YhaV-PrlF toxin-antitoxin module